MELVYHGTKINSAIQIGMDGGILSPWDQKIRDLKKISEFSNMPTKDLEEEALRQVGIGFTPWGLELGVKSISLATTFKYSQEYADGFDKISEGGAILGFEVDKNLKDMFPNLDRMAWVHISRRFSLDTLREIHLSPKARLRESEVRMAYAKYDPRVFYL